MRQSHWRYERVPKTLSGQLPYRPGREEAPLHCDGCTEREMLRIWQINDLVDDEKAALARGESAVLSWRQHNVRKERKACSLLDVGGHCCRLDTKPLSMTPPLVELRGGSRIFSEQ